MIKVHYLEIWKEISEEPCERIKSLWVGDGGQGRVGRELSFLILNALHILDFSLCTLIQIVKLFAPRLYVPEHEEGLRRSHDSMPQGEGSSWGKAEQGR